MKIATNVSWNTLARYSAMMWNNWRGHYIANGSDMVKLIAGKGKGFTLTLKTLSEVVENAIASFGEARKEDGVYWGNRDYMDGSRTSRSVACHREYMALTKTIRNLKAEYKNWLKSAEEVGLWEYDTDDVEFITLTNGEKALSDYVISGHKSVPVLR